MNLQYYSLPLALDELTRKKDLSKCSLQQSVAQNLHLILTTAFGELPIDENFGCSIWDHDFDNMTTGHKNKELIRQSLLTSIQQYEKRLSNIRIDVLLGQEEIIAKINGCRIKKVIRITITGVLKSTNETFKYHDSFYIGPLSYQLT